MERWFHVTNKQTSVRREREVKKEIKQTEGDVLVVFLSGGDVRLSSTRLLTHIVHQPGEASAETRTIKPTCWDQNLFCPYSASVLLQSWLVPFGPDGSSISCCFGFLIGSFKYTTFWVTLAGRCPLPSYLRTAEVTGVRAGIRSGAGDPPAPRRPLDCCRGTPAS